VSESLAGWATVDITPDIGVPLGGRGPQFAGIDEVVDPLFAQALVLCDARGHRTLIVSLDVVGIGTAFSFAVRQNLAALTGIPYESVILNFSHTHSGPMTIMDKYPVIADTPANLAAYEARLAERIASVSLAAVANVAPVRAMPFAGSTQIGMNRRQRQPDGGVSMQPDPDGFVVRELWGLDLQRVSSSGSGSRGNSEGATGSRCILFSAACHAVTVYSWKWAACSADFPGAARNELSRALGPGVQAQFLQGFGGNVRPARLVDREAVKFRPAVDGDHLEIGKALARDVQTALAADPPAVELDIRGASGRFRAWRDAERLEPQAHWQRMSESESELERNFGRYWLEAVKCGEPLARCVPWEIGVLRLTAGTRAAWLAGEVCGEWLPLIRSWLGDDEIRGLGYCQDLPGYLPTAALIAEGGYEAIASNWYRKTGPAPFDPRIESEARDALQALHREIQ